ncbi:MAG: alkaline phosphatase family protein [Pseudomonadota bacterium]
MATQQSATVSITNASRGNAVITLFHSNSSNGTQRGQWSIGPGATGGPLPVLFQTGFGTGGILDYWSVMLFVKDGPDAGLYISSGSAIVPWWKEAQLQHADAGTSPTLSVSPTGFAIALASGTTQDGMTRLSPAATKPISHAFVLMLENRSFDNMLGMSGLPGITAASTADSNSYVDPKGVTHTYYVQRGAPLALPSDPGHEFADVVEQLCGQGKTFDNVPPAHMAYPPITNGGFAASYATSTTEYPHLRPPAIDVQEIMDCFDTPAQLPVLYALAEKFAVCDHWFSSLPGPTWPNRFFLHGASSAGFDDSPKNTQIVRWEIPGNGFNYPHGSIFQHLDSARIPYRFYHDAGADFLSSYSDDPAAGSILGAVPQVSALTGISLTDFNGMEQFASDLQGPYPYPYTFIEPHYGDLTGNYAGGSSQHPMDDVYGGEHLLAATAKAIQDSPYWESSLLLVIYDEHGGFYDSAQPPAAVAPGDNPDYGYNVHGFDFTTLGVRVPAVIVSPLIQHYTVDCTPYDHSSVPKLLEDLWQLAPLTQRDAAAKSPLAGLSTMPRSDRIDIPTPMPPLGAAKAVRTVAARAAALAQPIPESGNLVGALANLRKADVELSGGTPLGIAAVASRFATVRTMADAEGYAAEVLAKVRMVQRERATVARQRPS